MENNNPLTVITVILTIAVFSVFPFLFSTYWLSVFNVAFIYAILASSWSLLGGFAGQFSFAHVAFAGIAGYGSSLAVKYLSMPLYFSIPVAIAFSIIIGFFIGILCLRLRGTYLALFTIAFSEIIRRVLNGEEAVTEGQRGLEAPGLIQGAGEITYYYVLFGFLLVTLLILYLITQSKWGLFFRSLREDETAASSMGVNVVRYKILAFVVTSGFAGLAGVLQAHYVRFLVPSSVSIPRMGRVIIMAILGGLENIFAAAGGGFLVWLGLEWLREFGTWRLLIFGALLMITLKFTPEGLLVFMVKKFKRGITKLLA